MTTPQNNPESTPENALPQKAVAINRLKLIGLIGAFIGPLLLAAIWLQYAERTGKSMGSTARGELIEPAFPLQAFAFEERAAEKPFDQEAIQGIWSMVYLPEGECAEICERNLYNMRQVWLALGRHMDRVQRVLVQYPDSPVPEGILEFHPGLRVLAGDRQQFLGQAEDAQQGMNPALEPIYLIDPFGNLMMRFPADLPPKSMLKDIKHLLRVSRIG